MQQAFSGELVSAYICTGVEITLDDTVTVNESEVFTICLNISELSEGRERDVYVSLIITSKTNTEGNNFLKKLKILCKVPISTDVSDITAENLSIAIPPGMSKACIQLLAVDDKLVEDDELNILDNDGVY